MAERGLTVDHSTVARWVLRYAPVRNDRIRSEMRRPNRSWRCDDTYIRVVGRWAYLYRAIDSAGSTIDFPLSPRRDFIAARAFLQLAVAQAGRIQPRVINVDGHAAYPAAIDDLKRSSELNRRCRCRRPHHVNNRIEHDHRFVKKRVVASQWFRDLSTER
jgi:IS6 family transposase